MKYSISIAVLLVSLSHCLAQSGNSSTFNNPCVESYTQKQRDSIPNPTPGTIVYNVTTSCLDIYRKNGWISYCEDKPEENVTQNQNRFKRDPNTGEVQYFNGKTWVKYQVAETKKPKVIDELSESKTKGVASEKEVQEPETKIVAEGEEVIPGCEKYPTKAFAGKDLVSTEDVQLEGNYPAFGKGKWLIIRGDGGVVGDTTDPRSFFSGVQGTTYVLRWMIYTPCDTNYDDALVRIRPPCKPEPSQSFAGADQYNVEEEQVILAANTPKSGDGNWSVVSGNGGKIVSPFDPGSPFIGIPGESYVLRWTIRTECGLTQDDILITFKKPCAPKPSEAIAGEDQIDIDTCILDATPPENGKGMWSIHKGKYGGLSNPYAFNSEFKGRPGIRYVLRWTVKTVCGSTYDDVEIKFAQPCPNTFVDSRDGKRYSSVRMGKECWMQENLKYMPGDINYWCYDGYQENCDLYGPLYQWSTAMAGSKTESAQGICPEGWHVPSDDEWVKLLSLPETNGLSLQSQKEGEFAIRMGGTRYTNGKFFNKGEYAYFWSSTAKDDKTAWNRYFINKSNSTDHFAANIEHSFSVRCVKDKKE